MGYFIAFMIVIYLASLVGSAMWAMIRWYDKDERLWGIIPLSLLVIGLGTAITATINAEDQGPCLREETGYATDNGVITPYTYCVERGEWVK